MVDPCFIRDKIPNDLAAGGIEQHEESVVVIKVTRDAEVFYEEKSEYGRRISAVNLYYSQDMLESLTIRDLHKKHRI